MPINATKMNENNAEALNESFEIIESVPAQI
jgi:hypothetical protein